ncbi:hypothetical protein [Nonomuraea sp. NPDC050310]|uniref:hypothetical protein n=1 Tax=unclassified Nonomuraea TaxID=2593643 RepID=UPI00340FBECC
MGLTRSGPVLPLLLLVVTGCAAGAPAGTAGGPAPASPSATATAKSLEEQERAAEEWKAACMKRKGFRYVPFVPKRPKTADAAKLDNGDYEATKRYRAKYGFHAFAALVMPKDPQANPASMYDDNPNDKITSKLSESQAASYFKASEKCFVERVKAETGKTVKGYVDHSEQYSKAWEAVTARLLDGDARLADLAVAYADCLKGQGIKVTSAKPSKIGRAASDLIFDELWALGKKQYPKATMNYMPRMTPEEAKPYFAKEVRTALADLDCGREFDEAARPKQKEVGEIMDREWGRGI